MHPSLGPYEESYGEEERAALAGLMASYPGGLMGVAWAVLVLSSKMYGGRCWEVWREQAGTDEGPQAWACLAWMRTNTVSLCSPGCFADVWRRLHPEESSTYT